MKLFGSVCEAGWLVGWIFKRLARGSSWVWGRTDNLVRTPVRIELRCGRGRALWIWPPREPSDRCHLCGSSRPEGRKLPGWFFPFLFCLFYLFTLTKKYIFITYSISYKCKTIHSYLERWFFTLKISTLKLLISLFYKTNFIFITFKPNKIE